MIVSGDVRIFVRPGVGDIHHAIEVLGAPMLQRADRVAVAIVGKVVHLDFRADAQPAEQRE